MIRKTYKEETVRKAKILVEKGMKNLEIALALDIELNTLRDWIKKYKWKRNRYIKMLNAMRIVEIADDIERYENEKEERESILKKYKEDYQAFLDHQREILSGEKIQMNSAIALERMAASMEKSYNFHRALFSVDLPKSLEEQERDKYERMFKQDLENIKVQMSKEKLELEKLKAKLLEDDEDGNNNNLEVEFI